MPAKVNFIIGRAGTGKTHSIYSHIARNEKAAKRSVLIVPDRQRSKPNVRFPNTSEAAFFIHPFCRSQRLHAVY